MNTLSKLKPILIFGLVLSASTMFSHDAPVHRAITINAAESALGASSGYASFFDLISSDLPFVDATNSMVDGSWREDAFNIDEGGIRSYNHFYDPLDTTYGKGLSDYPPDIRIIIGNNSFVWASISNCPGLNIYLPLPNVNTMNTRSWQNARNKEWLGLTATNQSDRFTALANMFRDVGQVMHLLQDTSQPQHVRNEQHLVNTPWQSPIEEYGSANVTNLNYQHGVLDWRGANFTKLEDFWDRHLYNGSSTALNNAENGWAQLGLAEWCNGNFLGARHLYAEYYQPGDIEYYPYPSRNMSTDYPQKIANLPSGIQTLTLKNGQQGQAIYVNKTGDGVTYPDISRFTYFGDKFPSFGMMTINDPNVLSNYHNIFIPKAVKYSAGLLDYYFRGTLGLGITNLPDGTYGLYITNTSSQDFQGGSFHLYFDTNGVRTELTGTNFFSGYTRALASGNSIIAVFYPLASAESYTLVYQGTIGTTGGAASDPVDTGMAIAAQNFQPAPGLSCPSADPTSAFYAFRIAGYYDGMIITDGPGSSAPPWNGVVDVLPMPDNQWWVSSMPSFSIDNKTIADSSGGGVSLGLYDCPGEFWWSGNVITWLFIVNSEDNTIYSIWGKSGGTTPAGIYTFIPSWSSSTNQISSLVMEQVPRFPANFQTRQTETQKRPPP
jgi:hypothetical protein